MTQPPSQPHQWWQPHEQNSGPLPQQQYPQPMTPPQPTGTGFGGSFSSEYGGFGAFDDDSPAKRGKSRKPWIISAIVVVVLAAAGGAAAWFSGMFTDEVLDQESLHEGVATVLQDSYGEHDVSNVSCPADQKIAAGHTFNCTVDIAGESKTVKIRILNNEPEYEVGAPH